MRSGRRCVGLIRVLDQDDESACCCEEDPRGCGLYPPALKGSAGSPHPIRHREEQPGGDSSVVFGHRSEERFTRRARLHVVDGVELRRSPPVPSGEGEQHGSTALGGQPEPAEHEQELESQVGARTGQPHGDRPSAHVGLIGEGGQIGTAHLVSHQEVSFVGVDVGERRRKSLRLLLVDGALFGIGGVVVLDQAVKVAVLH